MSYSRVFCKGLGNRYSNRLLIVAAASLKGGRRKALCLIALVAFVKIHYGHAQVCMCVLTHAGACMPWHTWESEDSFQDFVLSFHCGIQELNSLAQQESTFTVEPSR